MAKQAPVAKHPGAKLLEQLKKRNVTQQRLATALAVSATQLNEVIKGKRPVTVKLAVSLEALLFSPALHWLIWQAEYDIAQELKERVL